MKRREDGRRRESLLVGCARLACLPLIPNYFIRSFELVGNGIIEFVEKTNFVYFVLKCYGYFLRKLFYSGFNCNIVRIAKFLDIHY